jgi:putative ABC transport system substrate-binding protein
MMVAPTPGLMKVEDPSGNAPANLLGVGENLDYIDTSFSLIPQLVHPRGAKLRVGILYNQSEPQSAEALVKIKAIAARLGADIEAVSVSSSADVALSVQALLSKGIDAFFANPDNVVFSAFENIIKSCNNGRIPVFTSEAGLVARGAVAAYGADIYKWGYQAGAQAATYLKTKKTDGMKWEMVQLRRRVYNAQSAKAFNIQLPATFEAVK